MNQARQNLKKVIDAFLNQSDKTVEQVKQHQRPLSNEDFEVLAEKIWELRHFAIELLEQKPDETTWYNASIIKDVTDQPLHIDDRTSVSLVHAASEVKRDHRIHSLETIVHALAEEDTLRNVLFEDLEQISRELAA